jgi:hypothetical protein
MKFTFCDTLDPKTLVPISTGGGIKVLTCSKTKFLVLEDRRGQVAGNERLDLQGSVISSPLGALLFFFLQLTPSLTASSLIFPSAVTTLKIFLYCTEPYVAV